MKRTLPADCYMDCPRCAGTGIYSGHGTCFRCEGRRVVHNAKGRAELARREAEDARREEIKSTLERLAKAEAVLNPNVLRLASIAAMRARLAELGA